MATHQLHAAGNKIAILNGFDTTVIMQTGVHIPQNKLDNAQMVMIGTDDFAPGSCAL